MYLFSALEISPSAKTDLGIVDVISGFTQIYAMCKRMQLLTAGDKNSHLLSAAVPGAE
jgi:hypothetical protein